MNVSYKTERKGQFELSICYDTQTESPREWNNLFTFVGGDHKFDNCYDEFENSNNIRKIVINGAGEISPSFAKDNITFPLFVYDHTGVTFSTSPFNSAFDSGIVGYVYVSKEDVREEYEVKRISKKIMGIVMKNLKSELETLNKWVNNEVYCYDLYENDELIESCGGFYDLDSIYLEVDWANK